MPSATAATGPHVLRQINVAAVLTALRQAERAVARVADLMTTTGLSRPAVTRALADLRDADLVELVADETTRIGRPAQRARFRAELGHVAGVDVGPHKILVKIADLAGEVLTTHRIATPPAATGPEVFDLVTAGLDQAVAAAGLTHADLWAVCVGTPGIVDRDHGEVVLAPSIPGWAGLPVVPQLRDQLHCPVLIDNDVNLAVLAERWRGTAIGVESLVFVQWGERIGTGLIIDGAPYRGAHAAAGELGFLDLGLPPNDPTGRPAANEGTGPFERLVGAAAIHELAVAMTAGGRDRDLHAQLTAPGERDIAPLFAAAATGSPVAVAVVDRVAARFAQGLGALILLMDPEQVVIGGGLSRAGDTLLDPVRRHLVGRTLSSPTEVRASTLGEDAVVLGAVRHALDSTAERLTALA
ncbi:ROK family transcriptional regulator [Longispora sp. NPDC051575]|uniref:ROK family transcriptional regulator n=1 Tax=Longispora sp. NPDC051575 TaxID=3154943 RepID=UPI00343DA9BD